MHDELPTREKLLADIQPGMKLTKNLFLQIYGYNISTPGFADEAIAALEKIGCVRAREHYNALVQEYESKRDAELKEVAHWYRLECERQWEKRRKEGEEKRKQEEVEHLQRMSNKDLITLLENLTGAT